MTTEYSEWLDVATCYFCEQKYTADEWEDHHSPVENPLSHCHARCCDHPDCNEEDVPDLEPTHYNCCHAPKDMGHMFGCPNSPENEGGESHGVQE